VLRDLRDIPGPKILHTITKKGKGYGPAEAGSPTVWHAPGLFNKETGEIIKVVPKSPQPPKYQDVFGHSIVELAEKNPKIVGVTPAMPSGCSLNIMMKAMPDRAFDVGIAEQHAVTFSAGMATQGLVPFCNIYSSFMQRAYDQVVHDVALQNLNVVFCLDRGGLAGADGPTHHGNFDFAYFRCIPNMVVSAPMNEEELRDLMYTAQLPDQGPFSIRYPRGEGVMTEWKTPFKAIKVGTGRKLRSGTDIAVLSIGHIGNLAAKGIDALEAEGYSVAHYDMRFVKPIDELLLHEVFSKFKHVVTVEDHGLQGGMGSAVLEFMGDHGYAAHVKRLAIPDTFIEHGTQAELYRECGIDAIAVVEAVKEMVGEKKLSKDIKASA
jgi:1-deoxy-D-xylulose-5-phosphate synthase